MYNTEIIIKYFHYIFLGHSHFYFLFYFAKNKKRYLKGGLKYLSFYKIPNRVGWHTMGLVCKIVTPSQPITPHQMNTHISLH